ncbi:MAG: H-NS histone family protein [Thiomicrospira sp.]|uniref:H-NS histone family protein n=1 Tax=Thiomicrospira sp. TaxID=935 RepID=UPI0019E73C17|nr:H-NS histone family protein [Thiomicrospira sp.]MBE0494672.1 H-NS histone family protein [Thiomicrospira sp.]
MNLDKMRTMAVDELVELRQAIDKLISQKQKEQTKNLVEEFKVKAAKLGLSLEDIMGLETGKPRKTKGQKVAPKYRNPNDASQTWTGRGRKPLWVEDALNKGKKLDDLAI